MVALLQADLPGGYGVALLQTLLALAAVCVLAWVVLRWSARRGLGLGRGRIRVIEKVALDGRRALYLVSIGDRVMLIGAGDGGAPSLIAELDAAELPAAPDPPPGFAEIVERLRGRKAGARSIDDA